MAPKTVAGSKSSVTAAPKSPLFPRDPSNGDGFTSSERRRMVSSFRVVVRDSPDPMSERTTWTPAQFAAAQREAAARLAAQEEARYEAAQKARERRAIDSLKTLDLVMRLAEPGVSRTIMRQVALKGLRPLQYTEDVVAERQTAGLCAYPACSAAPRRPPASFSAGGLQLRIDFNARKVTNFVEAGKYCSAQCMRRSEWYRDKVLGRDATWASATPSDTVSDLELLEDVEEKEAQADQAAKSASLHGTNQTRAPGALAEVAPPAFFRLLITERDQPDEPPRPPSPSQLPPSERTGATRPQGHKADCASSRQCPSAGAAAKAQDHQTLVEPGREAEEPEELLAALALRDSLRAIGELA